MLLLHAAVSHLLYLLKEEVCALKVHFQGVFTYGLVEHAVVRRRQLAARKQIRRDSTEEWEVMVEKLGQVHINDGTQHQNILIFIRKFQLLTVDFIIKKHFLKR